MPERFRALLEAAREGGESAWTTIYRDLAPVVLGYLRANGAPEPDDPLSEVFLQVARDVARFEGDERSFRAWVFTIAHHRMVDARRHSARRPVEPVPEPPEPPTVELEDAAEQALARVGAEEVHRVLERLSPDQRAVLLLRVLGELTVDEVAKAVGKRPGAVKALQRRGLAAVRRELAKEGVTL
ncbi:MAG: RNA polymerase sigma factor [Solirubrobacterales bacterium]